MNWQGEEKRSGARFSYAHPATYVAMGSPTTLPDDVPQTTEIVDLSDMGMRLKVRGEAPEQGAVLRVRVPVFETQVTVPTLAQVRWKQRIQGFCQVGLNFVV